MKHVESEDSAAPLKSAPVKGMCWSYSLQVTKGIYIPCDGTDCPHDATHEAKGPHYHEALKDSAALPSPQPDWKAALRKYGRHLYGCSSLIEELPDEERACDCGFAWYEVRL